MADTLPNVVVPPNQWVDLYTETGLTVGTQIQVQNLGTTVVQLNTGASTPAPTSGYNAIRPLSLTFVSQTTPTGAWARSPGGQGLLNVGEA